MREASYNDRETAAIARATHVECRVFVMGEWRSMEFHKEPAYNETTLLQVVERVQAAIRHTPDLSRVAIYVTDGCMTCSIPNQYIPQSIRHLLESR